MIVGEGLCPLPLSRPNVRLKGAGSRTRPYEMRLALFAIKKRGQTITVCPLFLFIRLFNHRSALVGCGGEGNPRRANVYFQFFSVLIIEL